MKIFKNAKFIFMLFFLVFFTFACQNEKNTDVEETAASDATDSKEKTEEVKPLTEEETGYAFGVVIAKTIKDSGIHLNSKELLRGYKEAMKDGFATNSFMAAEKVLQQAFQEAQARKLAEKLETSKKFLDENKGKEGIFVTDSGLQYEIVLQGDGGTKPTVTDTVEVNYEGKLMDGSVFDSSDRAGKPIKIELTRVIPGWTEGLQLMSKGAKYRFYIPPELGYGEQGISQGGMTIIPPNEVLTFEIELVSINPIEDQDTEKK